MIGKLLELKGNVEAMKTSDEAEQGTDKETLQDKKMRDLLRDGDLKKFDEKIEDAVESDKKK
jgi:hypothetical protein